MEFLFKYLNKYCLIIGRVLLNTVQDLTFGKLQLKQLSIAYKIFLCKGFKRYRLEFSFLLKLLLQLTGTKY